jgi:hypothetical protein
MMGGRGWGARRVLGTAHEFSALQRQRSTLDARRSTLGAAVRVQSVSSQGRQRREAGRAPEDAGPVGPVGPAGAQGRAGGDRAQVALLTRARAHSCFKDSATTTKTALLHHSGRAARQTRDAMADAPETRMAQMSLSSRDCVAAVAAAAAGNKTPASCLTSVLPFSSQPSPFVPFRVPIHSPFTPSTWTQVDPRHYKALT